MRCPSCGHCFVPDNKPSLESMIDYANSIGLPQSEAEKAFDYYSACGWRVGRNPMKDVQAALRGWKRRWEESGKPGLQRLAAALPIKKPLSVWEIDQKLSAMRTERDKLLAHPDRKPNMVDYTWNDGEVSKVQSGWIYPIEVSRRINELNADAKELLKQKATL